MPFGYINETLGVDEGDGANFAKGKLVLIVVDTDKSSWVVGVDQRAGIVRQKGT